MSSSLKSERYGSSVSCLKGSAHATSTRCVGPSVSSGGVPHRFLIAAINCKFRPKGDCSQLGLSGVLDLVCV